jgi:hypothetical protein
MQNSLWGIDNTVAPVDESEEGIVLLATVQTGTTTETFIEAVPYFKGAAPKSHVSPVAKSTEVCQLEPQRIPAVHRPLLIAEVEAPE